MSSTKKKRQASSPVARAIDVLARDLACEIVRLDRDGEINETPAQELAAVGAFLLAYRRDRDERTARGGK